MEDSKAVATQLQIAHFSELRPYRDPLRVAAIAPEDGPDRVLEPRQSSGGPRMTRSTALREPTACNTHDALQVACSHRLRAKAHGRLELAPAQPGAWSSPRPSRALVWTLDLPERTPSYQSTILTQRRVWHGMGNRD